jgi:hypothetical protein
LEFVLLLGNQIIQLLADVLKFFVELLLLLDIRNFVFGLGEKLDNSVT